MGEERRVWHVLFGDALEEDKPEGMVITAEEVLSQQQRADLMLLWKSRPDIEPAGCFRRLWAVLPQLTVLEYKSRGRPPEPGVLDQLFAYGHIVARREREAKRISSPAELALVLDTGSLTPTVKGELAVYALEVHDAGGGLYRVDGALIQTWILALNEVSLDVERPLLGVFGTRPLEDLDKEGASWLAQRFMGRREQLKDLPDYEELIEQLASSAAGEEIFELRLRLLSEGKVRLSDDLRRELERLLKEEPPKS